MGSSLGGLVAFFQAARDPGAWQFAASLSGSFGWGSIGAHNQTLIERFASAGKLPLVWYLDSGGGPGSGCVDSDGDGIFEDSPDADDNYCETEQMRQTLEALGYASDSELFHYWEPGAQHNEAAWADLGGARRHHLAQPASASGSQSVADLFLDQVPPKHALAGIESPAAKS
jgi:hypothetical protein